MKKIISIITIIQNIMIPGHSPSAYLPNYYNLSPNSIYAVKVVASRKKNDFQPFFSYFSTWFCRKIPYPLLNWYIIRILDHGSNHGIINSLAPSSRYFLFIIYTWPHSNIISEGLFTSRPFAPINNPFNLSWDRHGDKFL
jgi:hypothetical protein